jgi:hypothetical protein
MFAAPELKPRLVTCDIGAPDPYTRLVSRGVQMPTGTAATRG